MNKKVWMSFVCLVGWTLSLNAAADGQNYLCSLKVATGVSQQPKVDLEEVVQLPSRPVEGQVVEVFEGADRYVFYLVDYVMDERQQKPKVSVGIYRYNKFEPKKRSVVTKVSGDAGQSLSLETNETGGTNVKLGCEAIEI